METGRLNLTIKNIIWLLNGYYSISETGYSRLKSLTIDKSISATIQTQAKKSGYDLVLAKGIVLYGGNDITAEIQKLVK